MDDKTMQLLVQAYQDLSLVSVKGHDDCIRMARALEVIDAILRETTQAKELVDREEN